ncbi:MAG: PEPxxWA-CTERM sorting domain-containing protein [Sphingobium sp.]|nr:PEPxxWA-CTERM sorting domain-containing protein [Sphingobium sp.]
MAGNIVPGSAGFYVIGANTGTGTLAPFAGIGQPSVIFNQAITVRKDGTGNIGATVLDPSTIMISGDTFSVNVALSLLPTTGFAPEKYGFNLWPRTGNGNALISDFAPENATLAAVPEAATWAMMIAGFTVVGAGMRQSRRRVIAFG